jgi:hypothetical protein
MGQLRCGAKWSKKIGKKAGPSTGTNILGLGYKNIVIAIVYVAV